MAALAPPNELFDAVGVIPCSIAIFSSALFCSGAGIGGGSINLAAYVSLLGLTARQAVPLSKATILGVALGGYLVTVSRRHPFRDRPMIDYEIALLMLPFALVGGMLGVFFNVMMPEYLIIASLVIILSVAVYKTFRKAITTSRHENLLLAHTKDAGPPPQQQPQQPQPQQSQQQPQQQPVRDGEAVVPILGGGPCRCGHGCVTGGGCCGAGVVAEAIPQDSARDAAKASGESQRAPLLPTTHNSEEAAKVVEKERHIPWRLLLALWTVWGIFVLVVIFSGYRETSIIGIECGSVAFWLALAAVACVLAIATAIQGYRLVRINTRKEKIGYPFAEGDVRWTLKKTVLLPVSCLLAGSLGVGRGLIQGPMLLYMGLHPQVATTTASFTILFNASATTLQYALIGSIDWRFALWYGSMSFLGAIVGQIALAAFIRRTGKASIAVFILAAVEAVSLVTLTTLGIKQMIENEDTMKFHHLCQ